MPKNIFKITEFEGGENRVKDPRDLALNECVRAKGVEFDKVGRIRVAGSSVEVVRMYQSESGGDGNLHLHNENDLKLQSGYGIFKFNHDFNMDEYAAGLNPQEVSTEFIAISSQDASDNLYVGFIDSKMAEFTEGVGGIPSFRSDIIDLGVTDFNPKISYYYVDGGLRIFDGEFRNSTVNTFYGHVKRNFFSEISTATYTPNRWVLENQSLELSSDANSNRPHEDAVIADSSLQFYSTLGSSYPPDDSTAIGEVRLEIEENVDATAGGVKFLITDSNETNTQNAIQTAVNHGFQSGDMIEIFGLVGSEVDIFNGQYEVIGISESSGGSGNFDKFTISCDATDSLLDSTTNDSTSAQAAYVSKVEDMLNPELRAKWIYGITYILDGGQETQLAKANGSASSSGIMSNSNYNSWDTFNNEPKMRFSFKHIAEGSANVEWSDRITGFRVYMKNIEGTTPEQVSQEWHLMIDVNFIKGIYVLPGTDATERVLYNDGGESFANYNNGGTAQNWDDIRFLSPITYESLNGYASDETIGDVRYKTAVIANDRCYIGNIEQNNQSYPDRIIKSPIGAYDVFPESGFIEGVTSDGDSIVKLEYFGDRLFCFKNNTLQIINLSDEEEYLEESLSGHGISHPCQAVKTNDGIAYVNKTGIYLHNGSELVNLTKDKIMPFNFNPKDLTTNGFFFEGAIPNLGYDIESNKLILVRSSTSHDYDVNITGDGDQDIDCAFLNGYVYSAAGSNIPKIGDIFRLTGTNGYDLEGDELSYAKFGEGGRTLKRYDYFIVTQNFGVSQRVEYLDLDPDTLIYDMTNNCISLRNFAFGANDSGYNMTNFINTNMFSDNNKLILLKDTTGVTQDGTDVEIRQWEDNSIAIEGSGNYSTFEYKTRDIDFGNPAVRKKIYKVYVTFKSNDGSSHANSEVRVYYLENQNSDPSTTTIGDWTEFDSTNSTNYSTGNGLYSEGSDPDWQVAELKPTSSINNIYSFQLLFRNEAGDVPRGFEINDISIVYRQKPIR